MKFRGLALAAAAITAATTFAYAQDYPASGNQSGNGVSATAPAPTDLGSAGTSGNTQSVQARRSMNRAGSNSSETTGSGTLTPSSGEMTETGNIQPDTTNGER